jgi:hypothetical protein
MKAWLKKFWKYTRGIFAFLFIAALLGGVWYIFLSLVSKPPLETTPVMIMVWASLALLILAAFPQILNRLKKLKVGDFEVELQEVLRKSTKENLISLSDLETPFFYEKGNIRLLKNIVASAMREPNKTYFLTVNVFPNQIYTYALAAYLYFLGFVVKSVAVIFVKDAPQQSKAVGKSSIIGVVNGQIVLREIFLRYGSIRKTLAGISPEPRGQEVDGDIDLLKFLNGIDLVWGDREAKFYEYILTVDQVNQWFASSMNTRMISSEINENDQKVLKKCLVDGNNFVIVVDDDALTSVIPLCDYTSRLTLRIMSSD